MNILNRTIAGVGLLLLALLVVFYRIRDYCLVGLGFTPKRGVFQITELQIDERVPRRTLWAIAGALALAVALPVAAVACHVPWLGLLSFGMIGAAGTFAQVSNAALAPAPIYTLRGTYTGGTSDTSPLAIAFPAAFAATAAALAAKYGVATAAYVDVFNYSAIGNVTAYAITCTNAQFTLTFTSSGSALSGFVCNLGATIINTETWR